MAPDGGKVAAVVVTYNRRQLLEVCLKALGDQEPLDAIIVVNNASTDDTQGFLAELSLPKPLHIKHSPVNSGGAGGFHQGIQAAVGLGFDHVWLMDDDARPAEGALAALLDAATLLAHNYGFLASNVVSEQGECMNTPVLDGRAQGNGYASWPQHLSSGLVKIRSATFVSVLLKASTIKALGLPVKEMFIWGDDSEFTQRISNTADCYLVGGSLVEHRRNSVASLSIVTELSAARLAMFHLMYRNSVYRLLEHDGYGAAAKFGLESFATLLSILLHAQDRRALRCWQVVKGVLSGYGFWRSTRGGYQTGP